MAGEELRYRRNLYEMTQAELAEALGVPRRETVAEWEGKKRIFASARDEITPRLILVHLFKDRVIDSEHCALLQPHIEMYDRFAETFVEYAAGVLAGHERRSPRSGINVRLKQRKRWSPDLVPAGR
jgi:transcriptional regulator with XRE-family HTH domain